MLTIECSGTPYQIGITHGRLARFHIARTIAFYTSLFQDNAKLTWPEVQALARDFEHVIRTKYPAYLEEMQGLADGSAQPLASIVAINVRTEIAFGLFSDACTALAWRTPQHTFLAQNWDWQRAQKENLVHLSITSTRHPHIRMVTEAGIIGKIGLNARGVGVCLNAIKARGVDIAKLPCHLGLRMVLESESAADAVRRLENEGIASACHFLIADPAGGVGMEWSSLGLRKVRMNEHGRLGHSNHFLNEPDEGCAHEANWLPDSHCRIERIEHLGRSLESNKSVGTIELRDVQALFRDEQNFPAAICRAAKATDTVETLFSIVMDLGIPRAEVAVGRPVEPEESFEMNF